MLSNWKSIKKKVASTPSYILVAAAFVLLIVVWTFSSDLGAWWSHRVSDIFERKDAQMEKQIQSLTKERDELITRAVSAEAREQVKALEAELLKQEAAKRGVDVANAQKKIDAALSDYHQDMEIIEAVKAGTVSRLELCLRQCADSAKLGYPCRADYCERFK